MKRKTIKELLEEAMPSVPVSNTGDWQPTGLGDIYPPTKQETDQRREIITKIRSILSHMTEAADKELTHMDAQYSYPFSAKFVSSLSYGSANLSNRLYEYIYATRNHPSFCFTKKGDDGKAICDCIRVKVLDDAVEIYLPYLPPRVNASRDHILSDLLLRKLCSVENRPRFNSVHISFTHVFSNATISGQRDLDNYYYKSVIDILSFIFGFPDSALTCSLSTEAVFTEKVPSGVYIKITPKVPKTEFFTELETQA